MAEEKNESQKFSSGNVYKKDQTDYMALLKRADEAKKIPDKPTMPYKPKEYKRKENGDEKFKALLNAAINRDDEEEEDAFEEFTPPVKNEPEKEIITETSEIKQEHVEENKDIKEPVEKEVQLSEEVNIDNVGNQTKKLKEEKENKTEEVKEVINKEQETAIQDKPPFLDKSENKLDSFEEILEKNKDKFKKFEDDGTGIKMADVIINSELLQKDKTLKKKFNPNPPANLIAGHDFNDPYLDDIYNYTYPEQMAELRIRKAEERQKKLEAQLADEAKMDELKSKRQKKKDVKKAKTDERIAEIKPRKPLKVPKGYPKEYVDPTDIEIDEKTGKPYYYFNFTNTIHYSKLRFLEKILPVAAIDDVLYDKGFLDGVADRQHDKSIKLNNMSAEEQYARDLRNTAVKIAAAAVFVFAIFFKVTFDIIPDNKYETALKTMEAMDYENAYYQFTELGNKELSVYFAKYSEAEMFLKVNKYHEAKEAFTLLLPFEEDVFKPKGINISDRVNECSYQIAMNYVLQGDYETAKNIFKEIHTYNDATTKYYECGFKIAKDAYEFANDEDVTDLKKALKYFYRVKKYSKEDVTGYIKNIQDSLYEKADKAYDNKDYETAIDIFQYLALFNYTNEGDGINSREMVNQCTYRYGLDLYKNRKYESARKVLAEIPDYKDSYVLSKECIYNIARILFENNPVGSIAEYSKIAGYKDADYTRNSSRLIMYGEWNVVEMNNSAITPITFGFYDDGQFRTNKQLMAVAISTNATPIYYEWDGEKFVAMDGEYTIKPRYDEEADKLVMTCNAPGQQFEYKCKREKTYEELIYNSEDNSQTETAQETMNQKYQNLINAYIEKKMDNIVTMNGADINIFDSTD